MVRVDSADEIGFRQFYNTQNLKTTDICQVFASSRTTVSRPQCTGRLLRRLFMNGCGSVLCVVAFQAEI